MRAREHAGAGLGLERGEGLSVWKRSPVAERQMHPLSSCFGRWPPVPCLITPSLSSRAPSNQVRVWGRGKEATELQAGPLPAPWACQPLICSCSYKYLQIPAAEEQDILHQLGLPAWKLRGRERGGRKGGAALEGPAARTPGFSSCFDKDYPVCPSVSSARTEEPEISAPLLQEAGTTPT